VLPSDEDEEDAKRLRVEYAVAQDGRPRVTVGFPEEFPVA
jgi:hypothetical protein